MDQKPKCSYANAIKLDEHTKFGLNPLANNILCQAIQNLILHLDSTVLIPDL